MRQIAQAMLKIAKIIEALPAEGRQMVAYEIHRTYGGVLLNGHHRKARPEPVEALTVADLIAELPNLLGVEPAEPLQQGYRLRDYRVDIGGRLTDGRLLLVEVKRFCLREAAIDQIRRSAAAGSEEAPVLPVLVGPQLASGINLADLAAEGIVVVLRPLAGGLHLATGGESPRRHPASRHGESPPLAPASRGESPRQVAASRPGKSPGESPEAPVVLEVPEKASSQVGVAAPQAEETTGKDEEKKDKHQLRVVVQEWVDLYEKHRGSKPIVGWPKECKRMKPVVELHGVEGTKTLLRRFFEADDEWIRESDYGIGAFLARVNKLSAQPATNGQPRGKLAPVIEGLRRFAERQSPPRSGVALTGEVLDDGQ